jgi:Tfp pilus assembly protein PilO
MRLIGKRKQVLVLIVTVMLVADFVLFGYLPSRRRMKSVKQAKTKQMQIIAKASSESRQLPDLKQQLQKLQNTVADFKLNVPTQRDIGIFLQQIVNLMTECDLTEQLVAPGKELKADGLNCIPVDMKCKGKLAQIFRFYQRLQKSGRLVRIERIKLTNDTNLTGDVTMQTQAVIYYRTGAEPDSRSEKY